MIKGKEEEKMVRMAIAAVFMHGILSSGGRENAGERTLVDRALEHADELIRKAK